MRGIETRRFTADDLPAAAELLAARHRRHRAAEPLLGNDFEDPAVAQEHLSQQWQDDDLSGSVALADDRVVGYLLAAEKARTTWGDNAWVESGGHALADDCPAEVARELYAHAAARWVDQGLTAHYVLVPAHDQALVDAWWRLGFGLQHEHAVREPLPGQAADPPAGVRLRHAERGDVPALAELDLLLPSHQARSPVFSSGPVSTYNEAAADWEQQFGAEERGDRTYATFVAERDGAVIGSSIGCRLTVSSGHTGPARPQGAGFLGWAVVRPDDRGSGVGRALGEAVLAWSATEGHPAVVTDWRATNLQSSRAWPRLGFRPTFHRLHRQVGH